LPWIFGSSNAIICSSSFGSRQKASNAWSKILLLVVAVEHHARERGMDVVAAREADRLERLERGEHPVRTDRHPGAAQDAGEVGDVLGEHAATPSGAESVQSVTLRRAAILPATDAGRP
jgi:hypothetical protein